MTEQEKVDLAEVHKKCNEIRESAFSAMQNALRYDEKMLKCTGYKTNEQAAIGHYKYAQGQIEQLNKEYFRKYPD